MASLAARRARISAWAVGSPKSSRALPAEARTSSPRATTAPTGTSPCRTNPLASSSASRIREASSTDAAIDVTIDGSPLPDEPDDGHVEVVALTDLGEVRIVALEPHLQAPGVRVPRARRRVGECARDLTPLIPALDGEDLELREADDIVLVDRPVVPVAAVPGFAGQGAGLPVLVHLAVRVRTRLGIETHVRVSHLGVRARDTRIAHREQPLDAH